MLAIWSTNGEYIFKVDDVWVAAPAHLSEMLENRYLMALLHVAEVRTEDFEGMK